MGRNWLTIMAVNKGNKVTKNVFAAETNDGFRQRFDKHVDEKGDRKNYSKKVPSADRLASWSPLSSLCILCIFNFLL